MSVLLTTSPPAAAVSVPGPTNFAELLARHPTLQIDQESYNINVTANFGEPMDAEAVLAAYAAHPGADRPAHLYLHVPLCSYICHFCNYVKRLLPADADQDAELGRWVDLLLRESAMVREQAPWVAQAAIESFYIGGGTAALLRPHHLERVIGHVRANYRLTPDCELSLEGNADNFSDAAYVAAARAAGFNRFSVGVQSLQAQVTRFTNRKHTPEMSIAAVRNLAATPHPFNVDMMFGLPYQTVDTVRHDIRTLIELGAPTITIYRFRNADREKMGIGNRSAWNLPTVRDRLHARGLFPDLHTIYAMRDAAVGELRGAGYLPSPCGWWSRPGTYPDGNIPRVSRNKWQRHDTMIALGPGAYGWLSGDGHVVQTHNISDIAGYAAHMTAGRTPPIAFGRRLSGGQAVAAALGFAYKAGQPIEIERFHREFGVDIARDEPFASAFAELQAHGLIERLSDPDAFRPTLDGEALHEEIISVYIHARLGGLATRVCNRV